LLPGREGVRVENGASRYAVLHLELGLLLLQLDVEGVFVLGICSLVLFCRLVASGRMHGALRESFLEVDIQAVCIVASTVQPSLVLHFTSIDTCACTEVVSHRCLVCRVEVSLHVVGGPSPPSRLEIRVILATSSLNSRRVDRVNSICCTLSHTYSVVTAALLAI
jgi:hypothetical protein